MAQQLAEEAEARRALEAERVTDTEARRALEAERAKEAEAR